MVIIIYVTGLDGVVCGLSSHGYKCAWSWYTELSKVSGNISQRFYLNFSEISSFKKGQNFIKIFPNYFKIYTNF